MSEIWGPHTQILLVLLFAVGGFLLGRIPGRATLLTRVEQLESMAEQADRRSAEHQRTSENMWERCQAAEEQVRGLQLSVVQIPEIAQRLSGVRDLREVPEHALDLVQEIFEPSYAVFYRVNKGQLVAVSRRGTSEFNVGHQLQPGEGIVGWTAIKQLPVTPEDAQHESAVVKQRNLDRCMPEQGFSLALPIVGGERTLGVILIGPATRTLPHAREIGRTIALITAITITSTMVLRREQLLAKTDGLTGLVNKTNIYQRLVELITAEDPPAQLSIFLLDIDNFKNYNDTNGHLPGDELLKQLGKLLADHSRQSEHVGRYGGEEFLLLMEHSSKREAMQAADRIRAVIADTPFEHRASQPGGAVTISGGVATWPEDAADVDSLLEAADNALYAAKNAGRNRVVAASDAALVAPQEEGSDLELITDLEKLD
jgi:diguanylate cyclase (GGDEF)-like protein